jgi:lysophospholipase L1-like esterase
VVGESTIQGFPYPPNLCASAFLEKYLQARLPGKRVEVLNLGITAVASYPLRRLMNEICAMQPDLVVLYAGHNEYYGAFGVASAQGAGTRIWQMGATLFVRSTALFQAGLDAVEKLAGARTTTSTGSARRELMELMAATGRIDPDSPLRRRAENSLTRNIGAILNTAKRHGVRVLLCSLVSNERDLQPVRSTPPPEAIRPEWERLFNRAVDRFSSGPVVARQSFLDAARIWPEHALTEFHIARTAEMLGQTTSALEHYTRARDLDAMPWRASSRFNGILRELAREHDVEFVDVEPFFREEAGGAPGWHFFADHLHPSLEGQALLARAMLSGIENGRMLPLAVRPTENWRDLAKQMGDNRLVRYYVAHLMANLFQRPPLDVDKPAARHTTLQQQRILAECEPSEKRAVGQYVHVAAVGGTTCSLSFLGGAEAMKDNMWGDASRYFRDARLESPRFTEKRLLAGYYLHLSQLRAGVFGPGEKSSAKALLSEGEYTANIRHVDRITLARAMAGLSLMCGDVAAAKRWAEVIPDEDPEAPGFLAEVRVIESLRRK